MMAMFLVFLAVSSFLRTTAYKTSNYYSTISLQNLLQNQRNVTKELEKFLTNTTQESSNNIDLVREYIKSYNDMVATDELVTEILMHPVSGFHFFKHVVVDWQQLMVALRRELVFADVVIKLHRYRLQLKFATMNDLQNTAASIGRMHYMYQIPMEEMIQGIIRANNTNKDVYRSRKGLDSWDCLTIGRASYEKNYVKAAVEWVQTAYKLAQNDKKVPLYEITDFLSIVLRKEKEIDSQPRVILIEETMGRLCRGEHLKNEKHSAELLCKYVHGSHLSSLLAPFKVEILSVNPPIMGIHDFISEDEANRMKKIASPKLFSSQVMKEENDGQSFERTSQQYWMANHEDPDLSFGVSRRIESATGLFTEASQPQHCCLAEQYQVLNYGIGGLYLTHRDYLAYNEGYEDDYWYKNGGDRLATFLIYLNDVEVGGATVFPLADVTVWPKRGFAAFWYNILKSGEPDPNTEHGGCPVLYGSKWISNKWIHEKFQLNKKCGLQETDVHEVL